MSTPLTDTIENLTSYINEITGEEDENLSDAVATLAEGYGNISIDDIASGDAPSGDIVITKAKSIGHSAFYRCKNIQSIYSETVESIRANAFVDCTGLVTVNFENLTDISTGAFSGCSSLTNFYAPKLKNVNTSDFVGAALKTVILPSLSFIADYGFRNCNSLEKVSLPSCIQIHSTSFYGVTKSFDIYLPNAESTYSGAPWGATNATIHYNTTFDENGEPVIE